jgi:hypothetical protein
MTLSLYREGPNGEIVTKKSFTNVSDNAWVYLRFDEPLPAGTYYLEQSEPIGTIAWWSHTEDVYNNGKAYIDGKPIEGDRTIHIAVEGSLIEDVSAGMTVWEKAQKAMEYMEQELSGSNGLVVIDNGENDGTPSGHASNYWDNLKMGYKEPYTNVYFYAATKAMSELCGQSKGTMKKPIIMRN